MARACLVAGVPGLPPPLVPPLERLPDEFELLVSERLSDTARLMMKRVGLYSEGEIRRYAPDLEYVSLTQTAQSLAARHRAEPLLDALRQARLPYAIIKGPATAEYYNENWPRSYTDIDIIVAPNDFTKVMGLAKGAGWREPEYIVPARRYFDRFCREGVNLHGESGGNVDIHHHVPPWSFSRGIEAKDVVCGASNPNRMAARQHLVLISSLHVINDRWKGKLGLQSMRDLLMLTSGMSPSDIAGVYQRAGMTWLLRMLNEFFQKLAPQAHICRAADTCRPSLRERASRPPTALRLNLLGGNSSTIPTSAAWALRLPVSRGLVYLAGSAIPSRRYISIYDKSYRHYWSRAVHGDRREFRSLLPVEKGSRTEPDEASEDRSSRPEAK